MLRKSFSYFVVLAFGMTNLPGGAFANGNFVGGEECEQNAGQEQRRNQKKGKEKKKQCNEQADAMGNTQQGAQNSSADGMGMMPALLGAALGGLAGLMAAKAAMKGAEKKAKEAEERIKKEIDDKFKQAQEEQKKQLDELKDQLGGGGTVGEAPNLGPSGLASQIENAIAAGDYEAVKKLIEANRDVLPESYIQDIESRIGSMAGKVDKVADQVKDVVPVNPLMGENLDEAGNRDIASHNAAVGEQALGPSGGGIAIRHALDNGMIEETREMIMNLIERGEVRTAAGHISQLEMSSDVQMAQLGRELRVALDQKLEKMGLPAGDVGLGLLSTAIN